MRSRYSAYVLNLPDYIIQTTHPASPDYTENKFAWKKEISNFSKHSQFQRLQVLDFKESHTMATVTFTAYLMQDDQEATFTERSYFEKWKGRWLYRGGQLAQGYVPNLITSGQLRLLPLAYYGEAVLRKKASSIKEITSEIRHLVDEMVETMDASNGIGLAAPQVHHSIRLFVMHMPIEKEKSLELGDVKIFINPSVISESEEQYDGQEGCLSIPALRASVKRPKQITVKYTDLEGKILEERFEGWAARVILHENDHLNGVLFIDRLDPSEQEQLKPFLEILEKRLHDGKSL
jgi:peptide deformylase